MAFHAIKAGEGDVFISAGVETVSRFVKGSADGWPDTHNPALRRGRGSAPPRSPSRARASGTTRARTAPLPDVYIAMGQTAENLALAKDVSREDMDHFGVRSQNLPSRRSRTASGREDITPVTLPDGTVVVDGRRPARRRHLRGGRPALKPVFRPDGRVTAGNCCPLNDGAAAVVIMSDTKAAELGLTPLARIVATGVSGAVAGDHGPRPGRGVAAGAGAAPA